MSIGIWSTHTPYNETSVRKYAFMRAGVYALWVYYKSGRWECFYVGKTDNIQNRLLEHLGNDEPNECIKENVKYKGGFSLIEITTETERSGSEKYLYDMMKPECNKNDPGGKPLPIPLPPEPST